MGFVVSLLCGPAQAADLNPNVPGIETPEVESIQTPPEANVPGYALPTPEPRPWGPSFDCNDPAIPSTVGSYNWALGSVSASSEAGAAHVIKRLKCAFDATAQGRIELTGLADATAPTDELVSEVAKAPCVKLILARARRERVFSANELVALARVCSVLVLALEEYVEPFGLIVQMLDSGYLLVKVSKQVTHRGVLFQIKGEG